MSDCSAAPIVRPHRRRSGRLLALLTLAAFAPGLASAFTRQEIAQGFRDDQVIAKPRAEFRTSTAAAETAEGMAVRRSFSQVEDLRVLQLNPAETVPAAIQRLRATGRYEYVEPDRLRFASATPNDPSYHQQWALTNDGQEAGTVGADIGARSAWDVRTNAAVDRSSRAVIVAIIDSGLRLTHTDLSANLWAATGRGNHGINTLASRSDPAYYVPSDENGHGTHVAGIIGAIGNNGLGTSGVAWTARMMPLKFMDTEGSGSTSDEIDCIVYAIANGAKVINASYGSAGYSTAEYNALRAARNAGIVVVVAAGNDGVDNDTTADYPAAYALDNIVTVASTNRGDVLSDFSNYGAGSVELAAPGEEILSTYNTGDRALETLSGTSMAAPHVAGAIALLRAQFPNDTYRQSINRLLRSAKRLPALSGKVQTGGRLDLAHALIETDTRPFNDGLAEAATLAGSNVRVRTSNAGATLEAGEPPPAGVAGASTSLWWTWTAPETAQVVIDTAGSDYDTVLGVYTGDTIAALQAVAANDDGLPAQTTSRVMIEAVAGATYRLTVSGKSGAIGYTALHVGTIPPHDAFATAKVLTGNSVRLSDTNRNASPESGEPTPISTGAGHTVWYRWIAPTSGHYSVAAYASDIDTVLGVYTGASVATLRPVATSKDSYTFASLINTDALASFNAVAGMEYTILVDNETDDATDGGSFVLTLADAAWETPTMDEITSSPAIGRDGTVYFGSMDGCVYAVGADGTRKWRYDTEKAIEGASPAIGSDGTIYIGSGNGYLYALEPAGAAERMKWRLPTASAITSTPAIGPDGTVYVRDDVALYAVATSGTGAGTIKWFYTLNTAAAAGTYASPAVASDGTIYIGTTGGLLAALTDHGTGATLKWQYTADGDIYTSPSIGADGAVHFATLAGTVYALEPGGSLRWSWSTDSGASVTSSLAVAADGTVFFGAYDNRLYALDRGGVERWSFPLGDEVRASSPAIGADGTVYVGCYDGLLYAVGQDGTLLRTYPTAKRIRSSPVLAGNRLYFGSSDAKIHAFDLVSGPQASAWPMFQQGSLHNARSLGTATSIEEQPRSLSVSAGSAATLSVTASSSLSLDYQWSKDGVAIAGANGPSLALANTEPTDTGVYTVTISTSAGTVTSAAATLSVSASPTIAAQPTGVAAPAGTSATLGVVAGESGLSYQWYRAGKSVSGTASATTATLTFAAVAPEQAGIYDCVVTAPGGAQALSRPAVLGVVPGPGTRTAGAATTRNEWQDIHHPNGAVYDQFLLTGAAGTFTADAGQIARMSFLDPNGSIVQVEMAGHGAVTVILDAATGPVDPTLYNQTGIQYMQGAATVIVAGADATTHVSLYSVGPGNNPAVVRSGVTYNGWAHVVVLGVVGEGLGGLHMGNGLFSASEGFAGIYAPGLQAIAQLPIVLHDIAALGDAQAYLYFGSGAGVEVRIAGGDLAQANGGAVSIGGLALVRMAAGQSAAGIAAPAQSCAGELVDDTGTALNASLVAGP
ncbi:MAG: PQQ-binding-like beta-propeller repeat protein [Opitutaceae bacterium]|nr:PQQ-binding-like beta-propeller repeat protein [Opitutaceae bacterium]